MAIVDFPMNSMVIFHSYVSLPGGKSSKTMISKRENVGLSAPRSSNSSGFRVPIVASRL